MFTPPDPAVVGAPGGETAQRNTRYSYLVQRLRTRQITMEEATELFGLMNGMLRASEAARALALRNSAAPAPPPVAGVPPPPPAPLGPSVSSDDFLLMGFLMMGAGAGLLAALTKRVQEGPASPPSRPATGDPAR